MSGIKSMPDLLNWDRSIMTRQVWEKSFVAAPYVDAPGRTWRALFVGSVTYHVVSQNGIWDPLWRVLQNSLRLFFWL